MARVVFLGTPRAAVSTLDLLSREHDVGLVVTRPDRAKGRSKRLVPSPVKEHAAASGLPVVQPAHRNELAPAISAQGPFDLGVVVAYGHILGTEVLDTPEKGLLNVHFSLLPRWRGAAPVARALMAGDTMTGVTIMKLDEGLDTGPIVTAQAVDIGEDEDTGALTERLAVMGARLLVGAVPQFLTGDLVPVEQTDEGMTYAEKIGKDDRPIDIESDPLSVVALIRALAPAPAATLEVDGDRHKIYEARLSDQTVEPGTWRRVAGRPIAGLRDGAVELMSVQSPGKRRQSGIDWANGRHSDGGIIR